MREPGLPTSEHARLAALASYRILDTPAEQGFDDLVDLASEMLGMPIALVSLIDADRQWFKARHGLAATETPRSVAFCAYAILQSEPLIIPDAALDPRFFDNPLVLQAPNVRSYVGVPLTDASGHTLGTLCVIDHVPRTMSAAQIEILIKLGRQVVHQLDLRRTREIAARLNATKSNFLSTISHELRTPLNGVIGMSRLLLRTQLSPEQSAMVTTVQVSGTRLLEMLDEILEFAALDVDSVSVVRVPMNVEELVVEIAAVLQPMAQSRQLVIDVECELGDAPNRLGDPVRFRQCLLALAGNAVKFAVSGGLRIRVVATPTDDVLVTVSDTGIGGSPHPRTLFEQSHPDAGSVGLATTRRLVELQGGSMGGTSDPKSGSQCWFRLPLPRLTPASPSRAVLRVLVMSDVRNDRLDQWLCQAGCHTELSTPASIQTFDASAFDLVILDDSLRDATKLATMQRVRASSTEIPIFLVGQLPLGALGPSIYVLRNPINPLELEAGLRAVRSRAKRSP